MQIGLFPADRGVEKWIVYQIGRVNGKTQIVGQPVILYATSERGAERAGKTWLRLMGQKKAKDSRILARQYNPSEDSELIRWGFLRPAEQ